MPSAPASAQYDNLPIFGAAGGVGGMPLAHMWENAPKQDYSGFWGKVDYYVLGGGHVDGVSYNIDGNPTGVAPLMGTPDFGKGGLRLVKGFRSLWKSLKGVKSAAKSSTQGGLNLFKWGAPQTGKNVGWKTGDYMLHLPNKGTPKLNWKANYGALRREMGLGKPIFDSYRTTGGNLIPTKGFLNSERSILQGRGWIYNPSKGAWMPPGF